MIAKRIGIVGGGIAGLASAIRFAVAGNTVEVLSRETW